MDRDSDLERIVNRDCDMKALTISLSIQQKNNNKIHCSNTSRPRQTLSHLFSPWKSHHKPHARAARSAKDAVAVSKFTNQGFDLFCLLKWEWNDWGFHVAVAIAKSFEVDLAARGLWWHIHGENKWDNVCRGRDLFKQCILLLFFVELIEKWLRLSCRGRDWQFFRGRRRVP